MRTALCPIELTADSTAMLDTGITYRQLDYWTRAGHLRADRSTPGSGYPRAWPAAEVGVARRMVRLCDAGLTVSAAERVARGSALAAGIDITFDGHRPVLRIPRPAGPPRLRIVTRKGAMTCVPPDSDVLCDASL